MGTIAKHENQIRFYYSSKNSLGRQLAAYIKSSEKKNLSIDISKTEVSGTQWTEIAEGLGTEVSGLIAADHPDFKEKYGDGKVNLKTNDWLKILENNPQLLKYPVAVNGKEYVRLKSAAAFKKFMEDDSAGIDNHW